MIELTSGNEYGGEEDGGSDSGPSEDNLEEEELALIVPLPKNEDKEPDTLLPPKP